VHGEPLSPQPRSWFDVSGRAAGRQEFSPEEKLNSSAAPFGESATPGPLCARWKSAGELPLLNKGETTNGKSIHRISQAAADGRKLIFSPAFELSLLTSAATQSNHA